MKKLNKLLFMTLAIFALSMFASSLIPGSTAKADTVAATSGSCGDNATWFLSSDGTLTISGTGDITSCPWLDPDGNGVWDGASNIYKVIIKDGITSCGSFFRCSSLQSIVLPEGIEVIGSQDFYLCGSLRSIELPDSVTSISAAAFQGCSALTSIKLGKGLGYIGIYAFEGCSSLKSIEIPHGVERILEGTFKDCNNLTSITIPGSVISIADNAFSVSYRSEPLTISGYTDSLAAYYAKTNNLTFIALEPCELDAQTSYIASDTINYDGKSHEEELISSLDIRCKDNHKLVKGIDYSVNFKNLATGYDCDTTNAGTITVTIEGMNGHIGTITGTFEIKGEEILPSNIDVYDFFDDFTYNGKEKQPTVVVTNAKGAVIFKDRDYTVEYKDNVNIGTASVIITGIGNYRGTITKHFTITAPKTQPEYNDGNTNQSESSTQMQQTESTEPDVFVIPTFINSVKNVKGRKLTIKWFRNATVNGYVVQISTDKTFTSNVTQKVIQSYKTTTYKSPKLKKKKTYYVRICTYMIENGKAYYSDWTKVKKVKIKK